MSIAESLIFKGKEITKKQGQPSTHSFVKIEFAKKKRKHSEVTKIIPNQKIKRDGFIIFLQ